MSAETDTSYRGRFAPSPTGPLHFGSLVTALASYLEARCHDGVWLVRIEDLDPLRESPQAIDSILHSLEAHSLFWDETVRRQSLRLDHYRQLLDRLIQQRRAYTCGCSRKELLAHGGRHPFKCRDGGHAPPERPLATRFALNDEVAHWQDLILGPQQQTVNAELDDPVLLRKEGFVAYQLAVVADDIDQNISHVIRGSDLLETTAQQNQIRRALKAALPEYGHIPVILNQQGQKLSKQNHAPALNDDAPANNLWHALQVLGQQPPPELARATADELLAWARTNWCRARIPLVSHQQPEA